MSKVGFFSIISLFASAFFLPLGSSADTDGLNAPSKITQIQWELETQCVVMSDQFLYCKGRAPMGGGFLVKDVGYSRVPYLGRVSTFSLKDSGGCAIELSGLLHCWDLANKGPNVPWPKDKTEKFSKVAGNHSFGCALNMSGEILCWGDGGHPISKVPLGLKPTKIGSPLAFKDIALAGSLCGIDLSNDLYCWGNNKSGLLGTGDTMNRTVDNPALVFQGVSKVVLNNPSCLSTLQGEIYCWKSLAGQQWLSPQKMDFPPVLDFDVNYQKKLVAITETGVSQSAVDGSWVVQAYHKVKSKPSFIRVNNETACFFSEDGYSGCATGRLASGSEEPVITSSTFSATMKIPKRVAPGVKVTLQLQNLNPTGSFRWLRDGIQIFNLYKPINNYYVVAESDVGKTLSGAAAFQGVSQRSSNWATTNLTQVLPSNYKFANCSELNGVYSSGVAGKSSHRNKGAKLKSKPLVSPKAFSANMHLDQDRDGIVCEK